MNLAARLRATAGRQPDAPALIGPGSIDNKVNVCTYKDLCQSIDAVAARLAAAGISPGATVGLLAPSGADYIVLTYALWRAGACVVPIPTELTATEKERIHREIHLDALLVDDSLKGQTHAITTGAPARVSERAAIVPVTPARAHPAGFAELDAAFIRFTSGTTRASKGVVLSHRSVYERICAANEALRVGPDDRVMWLLSMAYHFTVSIVSYLTFGAGIILCKNHLGATIARAAADGDATFIYGSPLHYELLAAGDGAPPLPRLRLALSTTASLRPDVADAFLSRFGVALGQAYGIIEIGLPCLNLGLEGAARASVGKVLPAYEIDLVEVERDGLGDNLRQFRFRGPGLLDAYYEPFRRRAEILDDGWFDTGDLGRLDEQGRVYLLGRSKEVINVGGMKLFPQEAEAVLEGHPAVAEACVFAHADRRLGEVPHARVVTRPGATPPSEPELIARCAAALSPYKVPARITFVKELPRTASGKRIRDESRLDAGDQGRHRHG